MALLAAAILSPQTGDFLLAMACAFSIGAAAVGALAFFLPHLRLKRLLNFLVYGQTGFLALSFLLLIRAFCRNDFSVRLVFEHSAARQPLFYKITALWGNHEGSVLLWLLILSLCTALLAREGNADSAHGFQKETALGIMGALNAGFGLFCLFASNPFVPLYPAPAEGRELSGLLQDPGLALHPPILYAGYVGFSVPFALAAACLSSGRLTPFALALIRKWSLGAWSFLTGGITLGAWWSYHVPGWGGFWFWDPVENAALIPWLSGTALLHSAIVSTRTGILKGWTLLLALLTFSFSILGTFLVRSGILNSIHAFASDPDRGIFILILLALASGGGTLLFLWRGPLFEQPVRANFFSLTGGLIFCNLLLCVLCGVVLLGTLYPSFIQLFPGEALSVGKPYFDSVCIPLFALLLFWLGAGYFLPTTQNPDWRTFFMASRIFAGLGIAAGTGAFFLLHAFWPALCAGLSVWCIAATLASHKPGAARPGMILAHTGLGIAALGICGMAASRSDVVALEPGETVHSAAGDWKFIQIRRGERENYRYIQAEIQTGSRTLCPERRLYQGSRQILSSAAVAPTFSGDYYAVLGRLQERNGREFGIFRLYFNPLADWIWAGGFLMFAGGLAGTPGKSRKKSQKRRTDPASCPETPQT